MRYSRISLLCRAALIFTLAGCFATSQPSPSTTTETAVVKPASGYSPKAQELLRNAALEIKSAYDPIALEESEQLRPFENGGGRSLVLGEAFYLRGVSGGAEGGDQPLADLVRAAHYAYDALFSDNCDKQGGMCDLLSELYQKATHSVVRSALPGLRSAPHIDASRYILDQQGDGDPITLSEWELSSTDDESQSTEPHFGAQMVGCRSERSRSSPGASRVCSPITFLITFEDRVSSDRAHAHLIGYDAVKTTAVQLHGREIALGAATVGTWRRILSSNSRAEGSITCLSDLDPTLPTSLFMVQEIAPNDRWSPLLSHLSNDETVVMNFNLCSFTAPLGLEGPELSAFIERALAFEKHLPVEIVLFSEGDENAQVARSLADTTRALRKRFPHGVLGVVVAGTMQIPERALTAPSQRFDNVTPQSPAERDIRRLLTRLLSDEGALLHKRPLSSSGDIDMNLSPVL